MAAEEQYALIIHREQTIIIFLIIVLAIALYFVLSKPKTIHLERDENGRLTDIINI